MVLDGGGRTPFNVKSRGIYAVHNIYSILVVLQYLLGYLGEVSNKVSWGGRAVMKK